MNPDTDQASETLPENQGEDEAVQRGIQVLESSRKRQFLAYLMTRDFWTVLILGQVLTLCITATSTFSTLLVHKGNSIPTFQTLFNYILLTLLFTSYTVYKYGPVRYFRLLYADGWKYAILSFLDVEGNYFTVLAYRYTDLLSAQLINFWAIVCVVVVSFSILNVRYKITQIVGIFTCCLGMAVLIISDHITTPGGDKTFKLKGDLFAFAGATFYGLSNVFEEWFVSKRPIYEVLGMIGLFGIIINGITATIFDRQSFATAEWDLDVAGFIFGYTVALGSFYSLGPIMFRMGSAAFFDISLLTGNFWGVLVGIKLFGYKIHPYYPYAFALIILGLTIYFLAGNIFGDSRKPWLGPNQEQGVVGVGTAKKKAIKVAQKQNPDCSAQCV